jgi:octaprenyl-diphosphate synthase
MDTGAAIAMLEDTANKAAAGGRLAERFEAILGTFETDLSYVESALLAVAADGRPPATGAADHLLSAGGKRIRPLTVLLSAACFGPVPAVARDLAVVAELVHSATLLHDDVIDDGMERRGSVTARKVWGNAVSVLAGDLILVHALGRTHAVAPELLSDLLETLRRLVDGEVVQLRGRTEIDFSEATYFGILQDKTASLFGWSARAGATVGGAPSSARVALATFGERMGLAFQLVDDALDYARDGAMTGKTVLADLSEGKVTLPLILAMAADSSLARDVSLARSGDGVAAERVGGRVRATGACDEVRARAVAETGRAVESLREIPESPAKEMLVAVATELTARSR